MKIQGLLRRNDHATTTMQLQQIFPGNMYMTVHLQIVVIHHINKLEKYKFYKLDFLHL